MAKAKKAGKKKAREIVVVGSKVKDVVRNAGLRSDGELVQAVSDAVHDVLRLCRWIHEVRRARRGWRARGSALTLAAVAAAMAILPAGHDVPNPTAMLGSDVMAQLLEDLRFMYDHVVLNHVLDDTIAEVKKLIGL